MNRKKITNAMLIVLALLLVVGMAYQFTPNIAGLFSGGAAGTPALKVNGQTITVEQLEQAKRGNPILSSTDTGVLGDDFKTYIVANQVQQALVTANTKDIKVSRTDVNAEVTKVREANNFQDNKAWTDALQGAGLTDASYRESVGEQLAIQRKVDDLKKTAPAPTDAEAKLYYDLNTAAFQSEARIQGRQIVVTDEAKAKALLAQAQGGADFAALATANSTEFKDRGGALGPVENGVPRPVAQVALPTDVGVGAFALTSGGLTGVIPSGGKFYIVKVEKYLAPAPKPFEEAKTDIMTALKTQKENAVVENWLSGLEKDAKIEYTDLNWKTENPTVATVAGKNIPYSDVVGGIVSNQQFGSLLQQVPPEQAGGMVNGILKPQVVQGLIQSYAAPEIARKLGLALSGTRQDIAAGLAAYGARDVTVTDADLQAFYDENKAQFETPASATISEASFRDRNQALAFRTDWKGAGDFTAAAGKAGATVSERGAVTAGDSKLSPELEAAVFKATALKDAGEGSLSDVIKVGERFSVLYATDLKQAVTQPLSSVRAQIEPQVLETKKGEAGQAFLTKEVAALKPTDNLEKVLADQAKRVAAAAPAPTTTPAAPGATPATPGTTPDSAAPADSAPADSATPPVDSTPEPMPADGTEPTPTPAEGAGSSATPPATETAPATEAPATPATP
ncbi:peptidylprolyl isomerase [Deinococcus arenicola]|uniref:peptidylprolyl isomerase n=1 Tax=Deinococcus arenicola TaxID=2994950 RepID=A0ABU4DQH3_9DEIO|nr:peptidyl-prolyl cis-trans isomerase [Deinococcus sp. ZS9-10]MDV6374623.1 peptidyl-prolyl cis-trans isomerase [Deinococcus sp. ZS9-10]